MSSPTQLLLAAGPTALATQHSAPAARATTLTRADQHAGKAAQRAADKAAKKAEKELARLRRQAERTAKQTEHTVKKATHNASKTVEPITAPVTDPGKKTTTHTPPNANRHHSGASHRSTPVGIGIGTATSTDGATDPGSGGIPPTRPAHGSTGGTHHQPSGGNANRHPSSRPSRTPSTTHVLARNDVPLESTGAMVLLGGLAVVALLVMSYAYLAGRRTPGPV